jgi:site-specific recombinase XerD
MTTNTELLVLDALRSVEGVTPVLPEVPAPKRADRAISREEVEALLREWEEDFIGGKAAATVRAVRSDWQQYMLWCEGTGTSPLPLSLKDLLAFIDNAIARGRKRSTINRYLFTIGKIHTVAGLPNPVQDPKFSVKFAARVKRLVKSGKNTAEQAAELTLKDLDRIQAALNPDRLTDLRDAALIALAGDTLCRESELAAVMLEHFIPNAHDDAVVLDVRKSKTNQEGAHDYRFVSPETWSRIQAWCDRAKIRSGFVFLTVSGRKRAPTPDEADALAALAKAKGTEPPSAPRLPMLAQEIARILRKRAVKAALPQAARVSGHSTRVGMANELARMGASERDLMDAGGWNSAQSVKRYTAQSQVGLGARAKLHEKHQSARGAAKSSSSGRTAESFRNNGPGSSRT